MLLTLLALSCAAVLIAAMSAVSNTPSDLMPGETPDERDARMAWWREARFGMFIHWGLFAVPAGEWKGEMWKFTLSPQYSEWLMHDARIPVAEYAKLAEQFNPTRFDVDAWVRVAKAAGMKYIIVTAKHHEGFAMFKSAASAFNIVDATPFKRDPMKELAEACARHGVRLGFYYSQNQDWHHPGADTWHIPHWDAAQDGDYADYLRDIVFPQIRELFTNYGQVSVLWFDTPGEPMTPDRARQFIPLLDLQPGVIVNDRLGGGFKGDTQTPEQHIPAQGYPGRDWETCMTMNESWGYRKGDDQYKSTETLLRNLIDIASKGGNYLLNVGPDATGTIPPPQAERLQQIGRWLAVNGESIYGTGPTCFGAEAGRFSDTKNDDSGKPLFEPEWVWRCTTKPGRVYIHRFAWRVDGVFELPPVSTKITRAYLLADPTRSPLAVEQRADKVILRALPGPPPDPIASVICLHIDEMPQDR